MASSLEEQEIDALDDFPTVALYIPSSDEEDDICSTKGDIKSLLKELKQVLVTEVGKVSGEVCILECRVKEVEREVTEFQQFKIDTTDSLTGLREICDSLQARIASLEDSSRRKD
ncbi:Hypothetical predicted protein [Pelobates cultripes]|uniref:Uncharacterized protein n=1 Tax=Pelobates cultripes TaxID=61616 RepID=A0AAD1R3K3_PELCU|nr:Hypothetical predicted protein [Pelobates cultripes]